MSESNGSATGLTVREWLAKMDAKLDRLDEKLDGKADASAVAALQSRVETIEREGSLHARRAEVEVQKVFARVEGIEQQQATWRQVEKDGETRLGEWAGWRRDVDAFRDSVNKRIAAWTGGAVVVGLFIGYAIRQVTG